MEYINVFVCSMMWVWFQWSQWFHGVLSSSVYVNWSSAQQQCKSYGGLLSYETFHEENVSDFLNENYQQIHEGDSAWVSELANYSQHTPFINSYGQCVYAYRVTQGVTNFTVEYGTRSCFWHGKESQNGYICVETDPYEFVNAPCDILILVQSIQKLYCIIHATSDWYQAQIHCMSMNLRLVDVIPKEIKQYMKINATYWTGLIREYKIMPSSIDISEGDICLSVRKVSAKFVLEPAQCSDVKLKLCQFSENISNEFLDDHTVTFALTSVLTVNNSSNVNETSEIHFKISLTLFGALLLIIVCLITVLYRKTRTTIPINNKITFEKGTTITRSNDSLVAEAKYYALDTERQDDFHYYSCPDKTATETGSGTSNDEHSQDSGVKQLDGIYLSNTSYQNVGHNVNRNLVQNKITYVSTKVPASNYNMYEEISERKEQVDAESEV